MIVNSIDLCVTDFPLEEVRFLHLDEVAHGGRRTDVSEYLDTLGLVKSCGPWN
jgi:hypothetical protein